MTLADRGILAVYCRSWEEFVLAAKVVDKDGRYVETDKGNLIQHPAVGVMNKAAERVLRYGQQLGLSPAARTRIEMPEVSRAGSIKDFVKREYKKSG